MAQDWNDILSRPIGRLKPDLPAAEGGWRAVRPLEGMSPRPQQPPLTLPEGDSMLSVRVPVQTEDRAPSAPPPASLTDQLSLTWANRKMRSRGAEEAPAEPRWPEATRSEPPAPQPETPRPAPALLRPLQAIARVLRREAPRTAEPPAPAPHEAPVRPEPPKQEPSPPRTEHNDAPSSEPAAPKPALDGGTSIPLTLATRSEPEPAPPAQPPAAATAEPSAPKQQEREPKAGGILRTLLRRDGPAERPEPATGSRAAATAPPLAAAATQAERALPLVHREPVPAPEPPVSGPPASFDAPPPPARPAAGPAASAPAPPAERPDPGEPLSPVLRSRMEGLVDVPLREVRVFRNQVSREVTASQRADAVTVENQVHMAPAKGNPSTPSGQALLAHEMSHVADGITAPASRRSPTPQQEARAQAVEHAVRQKAESPFPRPTAQAPDMRLEHRQAPAPAPAAQPAFVTPPVAARPAALASSAPTASRSSGGPMVLARAPLNRVPDAATPPRAAAPEPGPAALTSSAVAVQQPGHDEATMVARVVDAVMRRLRREGALERERRGAFRSEIGG